jgi:hypothetical protein
MQPGDMAMQTGDMPGLACLPFASLCHPVAVSCRIASGTTVITAVS